METLYNAQVGYLQDCVVLCNDCCHNKSGSKLYWVNVYPYKQTCHKCSKVMVEPQGEGWCELFPNLHLDTVPDDYEQCGYCGYDHSYEYTEAYKYHTDNPGEGYDEPQTHT